MVYTQELEERGRKWRGCYGGYGRQWRGNAVRCFGCEMRGVGGGRVVVVAGGRVLVGLGLVVG